MGVAKMFPWRKMVEIHCRIIAQHPRDCTKCSGWLVILTWLIKLFLLTRQRFLDVFACKLNYMSMAVMVLFLT